jgi:hypothetical protein
MKLLRCTLAQWADGLLLIGCSCLSPPPAPVAGGSNATPDRPF